MSAPALLYAERLARHEAAAATLAARSRRFSHLRGAVFLVGLVALGVAVAREPVAGWVALAAVAAFTGLVFVHAAVSRALDAEERAALVNRHALARVTGAWRALPDDGGDLRSPEHPYADDLDVFGHGSLFQRVSVAHTAQGRRELARLLASSASLSDARLRQGAVRELAPQLELRQALEALALVTAPSRATRGSTSASPSPLPEPFFAWAEAASSLPRAGLLRVASVVLPLITFGGLAAWWLAGFPAAVWIASAVLQLLCVLASGAETRAAFEALSATEGTLRRSGPMLELGESLEAEAELLRALRGGLLAEGTRPSAALGALWRVAGWFELRANGMVHPVVNLLLLWDLHCWFRLERWRRLYGQRVRGWFDAVGVLEALSSLAGHAFDEPEACWPELSDAPCVFVAVGLGHPLLSPDRRVGNDLTLAGPGRALLVTGSNMSGKSTWLRTLGLGLVLARAGAAAPARRLLVSPALELRTSLRVADSLEAGVSHFYAEIRRLAEIVAAARERPTFFLLDEVLHGTNSVERQLGARWLVAELLAAGASGVVTTHDVELCQLTGDAARAIELGHFREHVTAGRMEFDYRLRPGPVTSGNALRLMRELGLSVPLPAEQTAGDGVSTVCSTP